MGSLYCIYAFFFWLDGNRSLFSHSYIFEKKRKNLKVLGYKFVHARMIPLLERKTEVHVHIYLVTIQSGLTAVVQNIKCFVFI